MRHFQELLSEKDRVIEEMKIRLKRIEVDGAFQLDQETKRLIDELRIQKSQFLQDIDFLKTEISDRDIFIKELQETLTSRPTLCETSQIEQYVQELLAQLNIKNGKIEELETAQHNRHVKPPCEAAQPETTELRDHKTKEIRYERDPYLIEQNDQLSKELEESIQQEQKAKLLLKEKIDEIAHLNAIIHDLKSRPARTVIKKENVEIVRTLNSRIGEPLDILMTMFKKRQDLRLKQALFNALYYYRLFNKYRKLLMLKREKVLVNQKLEVYDGTYEVWVNMRQNIVDWLMDVFVRSADRAQTRKM